MASKKPFVPTDRVRSKAVGTCPGFVGRVVEYCGGTYVVASKSGAEWMRGLDELTRVDARTPLTDPGAG